MAQAPTPDPEPTPAPEAEPTPAELRAMILKLGEEVAEARSAAEAHSKVEDTLTSEGVSDEDAAKIADGVIAGLEARGVFEEPASEEPAPPTPVPEPTAGGEPASGESEGTPTPPPVNPVPGDEIDRRPEKRTFAERFMGKR